MTNYKEMYFALFNEITKVISALQEAQQLSEKMFLDDSDLNSLVTDGEEDGKKSLKRLSLIRGGSLQKR